jgi:hypothetical protein
VIIPSAFLLTNNPFNTNESKVLAPNNLAILTNSTSKLFIFLGNALKQASVTNSVKNSSYPNNLALKLLLIAFFIYSLLVISSTLYVTNSGNISNALLVAISYPNVIVLGCKPIFNNPSAYSNNSPANVITKFVASPHSLSYILLAITNILAAGCYTSNSFNTVAASDVTNTFYK